MKELRSLLSISIIMNADCCVEYLLERNNPKVRTHMSLTMR